MASYQRDPRMMTKLLSGKEIGTSKTRTENEEEEVVATTKSNDEEASPLDPKDYEEVVSVPKGWNNLLFSSTSIFT